MNKHSHPIRLSANACLSLATAAMFFFTLAETGSPEKLPLVIIPAQ